MGELSDYSYKPIGDGDIRLFSFASRQPLGNLWSGPPRLRSDDSNNDCKLEGELKSFRLSDAPSYKALSYMWGPEEDINEMQCVYLSNGVLRIRQNLHAFLQQLKRQHQSQPGSEMWIWIDSICIDQDLETDHASSERIDQIRLMDQIFESAGSVVVWLGPFQHVAAGVGSEAWNPIENIHWREMGLRKGVPLPPDPQPLKEICQKKYWSRYWIIQETVVAKSIEIWLGDQIIEWDKFQKLLSEYKMDDQKPFRLHQERRKRGIATLPELMEKYHEWDCKWQHDRVFALLGLVGKWTNKRVILKDYQVHPVVLHHRLLRENGEERQTKIFRFSEFLHGPLTRIDPNDPKLRIRQPSDADKRSIETAEIEISGYLVGWVGSFFKSEQDAFEEHHEYLNTRPELKSCRTDEISRFKENMGQIDDMFFEHNSPILALTSENGAVREILDRRKRRAQKPPHQRNPSQTSLCSPRPHTPQSCSPINRDGNKRRYFSIKHVTASTSECYCTGFTKGYIDRQDVVVQFEDSQIALVLSRRWRDSSMNWSDFNLKGKAVLARGCSCHEESLNSDITGRVFRFSVPDPVDENPYPKVTVRLKAAELVELTKPMLK